jgi:hypothetical protein
VVDVTKAKATPKDITKEAIATKVLFIFAKVSSGASRQPFYKTKT